jgi:drug/metabolite transporter (DMT)-like permease
MEIIACFIAAILSSSKDMVSKKVSFSVSGLLSAFASFSFALPYYVALLTLMWWLGLEEFAFSWAFLWLVLLRSLTDAAAEWLKMLSFSHGDISLVSTYLALAPLFLLITSPLITGDPLTNNGVLAVLLVVSGSLIAAYDSKRSRQQKSLLGIGYAIGSAIFFSLNSCFDRLAVQVASPTLSAAAMTLMAALLLAPFVLRQPQSIAICVEHRTSFLLRGLFEIGFMVLKLYALQYAQAPHVSALLGISLLLSIIGGKVLFKEEDFGRRLVAGLLVCAGVVLIVIEELPV